MAIETIDYLRWKFFQGNEAELLQNWHDKGLTGDDLAFQPEANTFTLKQTFSGEVQVGGPLNHDGAEVGFYGAVPAVQPVANPDTSAATLAELETEVNELKAALRSLGLIAT